MALGIDLTVTKDILNCEIHRHGFNFLRANSIL